MRRLAPKALGVYMGDERGQLEGEYFTLDAAGLDIPASSTSPAAIARDRVHRLPRVHGAAGGDMRRIHRAGGIWVLDYTLTDDGWRCAAVKAHWKADTGCMKANQRNKSDEGKRTGSAVLIKDEGGEE